MPTLGSTVYADYIAEQLNRADRRKASLEARGIAVVTTAVVIATVLVGLAALTESNHRSNNNFVLPVASQHWLRWALVAFTVAALGAIGTNVPVWIGYAGSKRLRGLLTTSWDDSPAIAEKNVSDIRLNVLRKLIFWNNVKGWVLFGAIGCEVVAIGCIARAVWLAF